MRVVVADLTTGDDAASRRDVRSILGAVLVQSATNDGGAFAVECADVRAAGLKSPTAWRRARRKGAAPFRLAICAQSNRMPSSLPTPLVPWRSACGPDEPRRCRAGSVIEATKSDGGNAGRIQSPPRMLFPFRTDGRPCESGRYGRRSDACGSLRDSEFHLRPRTNTHCMVFRKATLYEWCSRLLKRDTTWTFRPH